MRAKENPALNFMAGALEGFVSLRSRRAIQSPTSRRLAGIRPLAATPCAPCSPAAWHSIRPGTGQLPKRMVIHKTTAFKDGEIEGAFDTLPVSPVYV